MAQPFDGIADSYDRWYDTADGQAIFEAELECLRRLCPECRGRWLEIGVGTGRFASALGIAEGLDPSPKMLHLAARRGIMAYLATAEHLPFPDASFGGCLLALTLCFVDDPAQALTECRRVLRGEGSLLLGIIPADSPWGIAYERKKAEGHPVYAHARFLTSSKVVALAQEAGLVLNSAASTLFWGPGQAPEIPPRLETGIVAGAGLLTLLFTRPALDSPPRPGGVRER